MLGYIEYDDSCGKLRLKAEQRLGGTFLVLNMGRSVRGALAERRAERAARRMRSQGVRRAVFPVDFPHTAIFLRCGIFPVDPLPLRRALCVPYVRNRLDSMGRSNKDAVIAIAADHMTGAVEDICRTLALTYRYVMLSVRSGSEAFARTLRRQYGVSLLPDPSSDRMEHADALILFSPRSDLSRKNPILCALYLGGEGLPLVLSRELTAKVAPNCSREQLAAALHSMGLLSARQLLSEISC